MKALILAGGFGVRLREIIHGRPKHLTLINDKPFIRHLVKMLQKRDIKDLVISVGYLAQYIIDEFAHGYEDIKVEFSEDNRPLGTAGSLKNAQPYFQKDFFIINGDTYLDIDYQKLMATHQKNQALLTIVATTKHKNKGGIILTQKNSITKFVTDSEAKAPASSLRNAGIYVASPDIFKFIPARTKASLETDIIPQLVNQHKKIQLFTTNQEFIDIGSTTAYKQALKKLK